MPVRQSIKALFIDIDGTLLIPRPGTDKVSPYSLFEVLQVAGEQLGKLSREETHGRIDAICRANRYWQWTDFITALKLDPVEFWDFALELERSIWQLAEPEIPEVLERLRAAGYLLYITSNNPVCGILHKLRLMGLGDQHTAPLFSQLLGHAEFHASKSESQYWRKALAQTAWRPTEVATIGDLVQDDFATPHLAGIRLSYIIDRRRDLRTDSDQHLIFVQNFLQIEAHLLATPDMPPESATP